MTHQIQLREEVYQRALKRAQELGFESINEYVSDLVERDCEEVDFGPEFDAYLIRIRDEMDVGGLTYTLEEVREHLQQFRTDWLKNIGAK